MKICIVGGTGNISTSIVRRLVEQGHEVVCFNRGQTDSVPDGVRLIAGDRADRSAFEETIQREKFDAAIDMICFNAEQAASSLRAFRGVNQFVMCSTVCTYGVQYDWFPTTEDHPLRPTTDYGSNKVEADKLFLEAYHEEGFPVTIIKPSTTYGDSMGLLRQVAWEFSWIDRIRKGRPIIVCGDGNALMQFLHVDDAALAFAGVLGKEHCIGQTYNMVPRRYWTWAEYHRVAMQVIGKEVDVIGVPYADLERLEVPAFDVCRYIFRYHLYYSAEKLFRDVPEFQPSVSLEEGMRRVLEAMDRAGRVPNSDDLDWEDRIIERQQHVSA
ncbi:MAG: NAD-dependent epimerase/dehydratase family protein [Verrucomicrobia bacterium]|nr:NAD-dependent epimerase/dehydratase family protein [Verrucomicrobiota bacterium]MDA1086680.1 NAD-dependent epimerase/dehydratase family protein [Verrucomicrobiota bacterium]